MKKTYIISILVILNIVTIGQNIDKTFYLLGTLEDYMGRHYPKNNPSNWSYILTLHQNKLREIKRIEEVTGLKFKRKKKKKNCSNCQDFFELKSFWQTKKINSFYDFNKNKGIKDLMGFTFYTGYINCERILNATIDQQISFLAGQFLTVGEKTTQGYKYTLYNSPNRFECLIKVLQNLKCEITRKEKIEGIPTSYFIEFKPTEKIKIFFDNEILKKHKP